MRPKTVRWGCYQFPVQQVGDNFGTAAPTLALTTLLHCSVDITAAVILRDKCTRSKVIFIDDIQVFVVFSVFLFVEAGVIRNVFTFQVARILRSRVFILYSCFACCSTENNQATSPLFELAQLRLLQFQFVLSSYLLHDFPFWG